MENNPYCGPGYYPHDPIPPGPGTTEPPPKDSCEQLRISSLCEKGWQPLLLTGMLRDMLARHFAEATNIESDDLRRYIWQDSVETGILIESVHRWRGDLVEKRPAILIKRNSMRNRRFAIADLSGLTGQGFDVHTNLWVGSHTLFCIHGTGASVEILATEVQRTLNGFAPVIRQYLGLHKFAVMEVGAISEVEESSENFIVPVTVAWVYEETWELRLQSLPIRRIPLSIILDCPLTGEQQLFQPGFGVPV
jgi:hypothetical protein